MATHVCSYYCEGRTHAYIALTFPGVTADMLREATTRSLGTRGTVDCVRPAPEADVATAATTITSTISAQGKIMPSQAHDPRCSVPWLITVTYAEGTP